jgi:tellurite resistance protein
MTPSRPQVTGDPVSTSSFYMWRVIIAIAHADGRVQDEERAYIQRIVANMDRVYGLTDDMKATFKSDLDNPEMQNIAELMSHINDPAIRGQVVYFGGLLARLDGVMDPREEQILEKLHTDQMSSLDMEQIHAHVKEAVADEMFKHDLKISELRPQHGITGALDHMLLRLGIDVLD